MKHVHSSALGYLLGAGLLCFALACGGDSTHDTENRSRDNGASEQSGDLDPQRDRTSSAPNTGSVARVAPDGESELLGPVQADGPLGFSFRPPAVFRRAGDDFVAQARQALGNSPGAGATYFTLPRMIFALPGADARIFVGEFPMDGEVDDPAAWMDGYVQAARAKAANAEVTVSTRRIAGQDSIFLRIEAGAFRNDRVLIRTGKGTRIQIDYLIPAAGILELEGPVAASIESITTF